MKLEIYRQIFEKSNINLQ